MCINKQENLYALQVFLCALISRPMCTRAQLRGNIAMQQCLQWLLFKCHLICKTTHILSTRLHFINRKKHGRADQQGKTDIFMFYRTHFNLLPAANYEYYKFCYVNLAADNNTKHSNCYIRTKESIYQNPHIITIKYYSQILSTLHNDWANSYYSAM